MPSFQKASLLDGFDVPDVTNEDVRKQLDKLKSHTARSKNSIEQMPLMDRLRFIKKEVYKILGRYKNFVKVIYTEKDLENYINMAIEKGVLALDTETNNSLDPLTCKIMGLCLYVPNTKPVYVPLNHTTPETDEKLPNQVREEFASDMLRKLRDSDIKIIYHNGKFDIRVCYNTLGVYLPIWWDTMIASQLIDENAQAKLKYQYKVHVDPTVGTYNIEKLFTGLPYAWVDPEVFSLYAAIDSYDTYRLQQYQQKLFEEDGMERLYNLFLNIEIPIVTVTSHMEDSGICMDLDYVERLNTKFTKLRDKALQSMGNILLPYADKVRHMQDMGKLDTPINFNSDVQLNLLIYDIMRTPVIKEFGKKTSKEALKAIGNDFTKQLLKYRHYDKLITSFTVPLPGLISKKDGKLHASFNQMGKEDNNVRTGRFSSSDPKLKLGLQSVMVE